MTEESKLRFPPDYFRREDESDDRLFYREPRLVVHIDDHAIRAVGDYFSRTLPKDGVLLDFMSSWRSHLPEGFPKGKLVGLGLNAVEMAENPQLDEYVVHEVNSDPVLPFANETFDAAIITVSIQYIIKPVEVFQELNRVLKEGANLHVIYSNRMFPTKAVSIWISLDDQRRAQLIAAYFAASGGWDGPDALDISPRQPGFPTDPVYVVTARKQGVS